MNENVVALPGNIVPLARGEAVPEIVEALRAALAAAEAGGLRALGMAYVIDDGTQSPIVATDLQWGPMSPRHLFFAVSRLKRNVEDGVL